MVAATILSPIGDSIKATSIAALRGVNDHILSKIADPANLVTKIPKEITQSADYIPKSQEIIDFSSSSIFSSGWGIFQSSSKQLNYVFDLLLHPTRAHIALSRFLAHHSDIDHPNDLAHDILITSMAVILVTVSIVCIYKLLRALYLGVFHPSTGVYILDVATFNGFKPEWRVSSNEWVLRGQKWFHMHTEDIHFTRGILDRSGIGPNTHFPPGIATFPPDLSLESARREAEIVMFNCIDQLLAKNNIKPQDIDILVTNCSLFNPTPSLAAMIINHYKLREDIICYNLGGMGCSASPLAVNAASTSLLAHSKPHPVAVVVSMENITQNIYMGREKSLMLANALFRLGGAAILLTRDNVAVLNRPKPKWSIDYLTHIHTASNTDSYTCVFQDIDKEQKPGVRLDKSLMSIAAVAISKNMNIVGPKILPLSAKLDYAYRFVLKYVMTKILKKKSASKDAELIPNFKLAVNHFAIHAGGRGVLDAIQQTLKLTDADIKPSRDVLYKIGNSSSSSIWYEYKEIENNRKVKKGDILLAIAVGSGFKCNTLVLRRI